MKTPKQIRQTLKEHYQRKNGCEGKRRYLDESSARSRAEWDREKFYSKKKRREGGHRPYRCQFCGWWHIGTPTNPHFREDFVELVKKAESIHQRFESPDGMEFDEALELGMKKEEELEHGKYYVGFTRGAAVARWHAVNRKFYFQTTDRATRERVIREADYPYEEFFTELFVPLETVGPSRNQAVSIYFEASGG